MAGDGGVDNESADKACFKCKTEFDDVKSIIQCTQCNQFYHGRCEGVDMRGFHMKKSSWKCLTCTPNNLVESERARKRSRVDDESELSQTDNQLLKVLMSKIDELNNKVEFLMNENNELKKQISSLKSSQIQSSETASTDEIINVNEMNRGNGKTVKGKSNDSHRYSLVNNSNAATPPVNVWNKGTTTHVSGTTNTQTQPQYLEPNVMSVNKQNNPKEWTEVTHKRNRKPKRIEIRGTANSNKSDFGAAERQAWLYVGGCKWGTTASKVKEFLRDELPDAIFEVEEIPKHETNLSKKKSFKVGFTYEH